MDKIDRILKEVKSPGRYIGEEFNVIKKNWGETKLHVALAFPDLYEIGMSNLGFQIIYHLLNRRDDTLCERVFAPDLDMEKALSYYKIPLFSLESRTPLFNFHWIGFSISYELNYSGVLTILNLSGIPIFSNQRHEKDPLIIAGGPSMLNPEPLVPFIDVFFIGEAEEAIDELVDTYLEWKESKESKIELYKRWVEIEGVYIPSLYEEEDNKIKPKYFWVPEKIKRRIVKELDKAYFPTKPLVPLHSIVHDRGVIEIMRGCQRNCRFCLAGYIYRPKRLRSPEKIKEYIREIFKNTGYEEISLLSLSSNDYPYLERLIQDLNEEFSDKYLSFSLPSLRADKFSLGLSKKLQTVRKSGLTFAIEAGSERLRRVINKGLRTEDFLNTIRTAYEMGWKKIKLYFMLGLPTEEDEDIEELVELLLRIPQENRGIFIHVGFSVFIPKPHTPFQWEKFAEREVIEKRKEYILKRLKRGPFNLDFHDYNMSFLEAIFSRGDRKLAKILYSAWENGSRLEGWRDYLNISLWEKAFINNKIDQREYLREKSLDEGLPWDHILTGVSKEFLKKEREKAYKAEETPPCEWGYYCEFCGIVHE
ncbi:MAG: TIGR03960 family B12-binding radical SAM protein [Dictyoglomaceae bacterium]